MADENNIEGTINAATGLLKEIPVYQDALQPAAKELGVALQTIAKTVNLALAPVSAMVWGYEKIKDFAATRLAEKLKDVPEGKITTPDATIAGPALEALKYTGHKEELRDMYASLIATAMDADNLLKAHPAFVEIIKQLSPDEAKIVAYMNINGSQQPKVDVRAAKDATKATGRWAAMHYSLIAVDAQCQRPQLTAAYLVNLQRLGLVELREDYIINAGEDGVDPYNAILAHPEILHLEKLIQAEGRFVDIKKGAVFITPLGFQFCDACLR